MNMSAAKQKISLPQERHDPFNHSYYWPDPGIRVDVERLEEDGQAEITVHHDGENGARPLYWGRTNLLSAASCYAVTKRLSAHTELDWDNIFTQVSKLSFQAYRKGEDVESIGRRPAENSLHFQLWPLLEKGKATTIYAPGGSGKSYLSCYLALLVQTGCTGLDSDSFCFLPEQGNVLYLDWEGCREDHERRVWALKQGLGIGEEVTFLYRRCTRPLAADIETVQRMCLEYDISLVIIDSQMAASGYGPDPAVQATLFYNALRILKCTTLTLDHVSKEAWSSSSYDSTGPYGSVVKFNRARSVWEVKKSQEPGDDFLELAIKHIKHNEGRLYRPIGIRFNFDNGEGDSLESVRFSLIDIAGNSVLAKGSLSVKERLKAALQGGHKKAPELAEELGIDKDTTRNRLNENKKIFKRYNDGWGLIDN